VPAAGAEKVAAAFGFGVFARGGKTFGDKALVICEFVPAFQLIGSAPRTGLSLFKTFHSFFAFMPFQFNISTSY
jgi:hypothetical protein